MHAAEELLDLSDETKEALSSAAVAAYKEDEYWQGACAESSNDIAQRHRRNVIDACKRVLLTVPVEQRREKARKTAAKLFEGLASIVTSQCSWDALAPLVQEFCESRKLDYEVIAAYLKGEWLHRNRELFAQSFKNNMAVFELFEGMVAGTIPLPSSPQQPEEAAA